MWVELPLPADNLIKHKKKHTPKNNILYSCKLKIRAFKNKTTILRWYFDSISKSLSNRVEKSPQNCCLVFWKAQIFSLQDVVLRSVFFLIWVESCKHYLVKRLNSILKYVCWNEKQKLIVNRGLCNIYRVLVKWKQRTHRFERMRHSVPQWNIN